MIEKKNTPPYYEIRKGEIYKALLTQTGTTEPIATVVANDGGEVTWERTSMGQYVGTAAEIRWTIGRTAVAIHPTVGGTIIYATLINDTMIQVRTETVDEYTDNGMEGSLLEITVFN